MLVKRRKKIDSATNSAISAHSKKYIRAAEDDGFDFDDEDDEIDGISDAIDDVSDNIEDIQDAIEDVDDDDVAISINNNIADHYIAECEECGGIFISAVVESDQVIDYVSGECPLCGKQSDQYLKWIIRDATEEDV